MTDNEAQKILDKIVTQVFGIKNPLNLEQFKNKFAFDLTLPTKVTDFTSGEDTWTRGASNARYMKSDNPALKEDLMEPHQDLKDIRQILAIWQKTNFTTTEKHIDSINVAKSDTINNCENVYMSLDYGNSKNVIFCDGGFNNEYVAACPLSNTLSYCIRVEGSKDVSNSFEVTWSSKITNSMFINACYDMYECIFCSHVSGKQFCIANVQLTEEEYFKLKPMIIDWVFNG